MEAPSPALSTTLFPVHRPPGTVTPVRKLGAMGYARVRSVGLVGLEGHPVVVEAHVDAGLPALVLSGLPDASLNEARDRVRAAIVNSDEKWPQRRITVNLLPAELPKSGSGFDLAIAVVLLAG